MHKDDNYSGPIIKAAKKKDFVSRSKGWSAM